MGSVEKDGERQSLQKKESNKKNKMKMKRGIRMMEYGVCLFFLLAGWYPDHPALQSGLQT